MTMQVKFGLGSLTLSLILLERVKTPVCFVNTNLNEGVRPPNHLKKSC